MPIVTLTANPAIVDPGGSTTITLRVSRTNGNTGGFYLTSYGLGAFTHLSGTRPEGNPSEAVHSAVRTATTGDVAWMMRWTAPATKGSVDFEAWGVSGNGNDAKSGDDQGTARLSLAIGCGEGVMAYVDRDGDGWGITALTTRACEIGTGFATKGGDCDDNTKLSNPAMPEICNFYDDNCDGKVNEGLPIVTIYRDDDGDGHGARGTTDTRMGCGNTVGYATTNDDCDDRNRDISPKAMETCNNRDDDCDGMVDDGARAVCGIGWCARRAPTCDPQSCMPGSPLPETCNGLDDDCDGMVDDGELCGGGKTCHLAECLTREQAADAAAASNRERPPEAAEADGGMVMDARRAGTPGTPDPEDDELGGRREAGGCSVGAGGAASNTFAFSCALFTLALLLRRRRR